ncbi:MAG: NusG domain II-containing protein [Longibaculum sp.]
MKKKDLIVIVVLCVVIGIGYFIFNMMQGSKDTVGVYYKNELIESIDISVNKTYTFEGSYGKFSLEVKDRQYHAVNVECPNHDCEKQGWIKEGSSKTIVCLPNEIYVKQIGTEDQFQ